MIKDKLWKFARNRFKKKLGDTLCLAKWTQTNIYLATGKTHSCHHPNPHTIPVEEIEQDPSALHNTCYKIKQRQKMLDGEKPSECDYCWRVEETGGLSDRVTKSFTNWSRPFYNEILNQGAKGSAPKYLEVSFDNTCNLKCSYCGPSFSSKWVEELDRFGPWPNHHSGHNVIPNREDNPYVNAFWKWWPDLYKKLHTFRITGGEPLLSKNTYKVFDKLKHNPNKKMALGINTNLSVPQEILDKFISSVKDVKVKSLTIHTSCDTHGVAAEYARNGFDYKQWIKNCERILTEIPEVNLNIMVTYNVFSVTTFELFLKDVVELRNKFKKVGVSISYLRYPEQLAVWVLPQSFGTYIKTQIEFMKNNKFKATEINQLERILPLLEENKDRSKLQQQFIEFVNEHDKRRNTNFLESFPEMSSIV